MTKNHIESVHSLAAARERGNLQDMKQELRQGYDRGLELDIEKKAQDIAVLDNKHQEYVATVKQRDAEERERIQQQREGLEQRLMSEYRKASPGTTEAEAKAALPDLLHRHRLGEIDRQKEHLADARRRIAKVAL